MPAVLVTALALALVNLGIAELIALAVNARTFIPLWAAALLLAFGVAAAVGAVLLWRAYIRAATVR